MVAVLLTGLRSYAQNGQRLTLAEKSTPLIQVFKDIERQAGYGFVYDKTLLEGTHPVTLDMKDAPLTEVLDACLRDQGLVYHIHNNNIIITRKNAQLGLEQHGSGAPGIPGTGMAMNAPISGRVTNEKGEVLAGATVTAKNRAFRVNTAPGFGGAGVTMPTVAVTTNARGAYSIKAMLADSLVISCVGYKTRTVAIEKRNAIDVVLAISVSDLGEVVVNKGYYTTTQRLNTGDVSTVTSKDLEKQPVTNLLQALEGMVPGLSITAQSGNPGSNLTVLLRGQNSLANGNSPLYVVDGVPYSTNPLSQLTSAATGSQGSGGQNVAMAGLNPLNSFNLTDIESIEILKDADATAIYGSRGANGVILITTKKGKAGPTRIMVNTYTGINTLSRLQPYMKTPQYLEMRKEAFANDGIQPGVTDLDVNGSWDTTRYTNWAKQLIDHPSQTSHGDVSVSGGNESTQFLVGAAYNLATPTYSGNFSDKKTSAHFSISNTSSDKKFKLSFIGSYSEDDNNLPGDDISGKVTLPPNQPPLKAADGSLIWYATQNPGNPYATLLETYAASTKVLIGNAMLSYQLLPSLQLRSNFGYTNTSLTETRLDPKKAQAPPTVSNITAANSNFANNATNTWIIEPQAEFKHSLYKGLLDVLVGGTFQSNLQQGNSIYATGFNSDALLSNVAAAATTVVSNSYTLYRYEAVFGRIGYTLDNKYVLNLTGRRDGSSRFGPGRQYADLGAVGVGWIFGSEGFVKKNLPFLSYGKLRGSFGTTGNDQIGDYHYLNTYTSSSSYTYLGNKGLGPTSLYNPDYGWETNRKLEAALELGFLRDRILFTPVWFRNVSSNQLVSQNLAPTAGFNSVVANLDATIQNTGWEFQLTTTNIKSSSFTWKTLLNLSIERNKLLSFPGLATSSYANLYIVGQPVSIIKALPFAGVDAATGLYTFRSAQGTVTSTPSAVTDKTALVNVTPACYGGLENDFQYKRWDLDILLHFVKQKGRNDIWGSNGTVPGTMNNLPAYFADKVWQKPGDNSPIQRYTTNASLNAVLGYSYVQTSTKAYSDASYIRAQNISLSYQLATSWMNRMHFTGGKIYFRAQNLFTMTHYLGPDPETQGAVLPPFKTWTFGLQFTL